MTHRRNKDSKPTGVIDPRVQAVVTVDDSSTDALSLSRFVSTQSPVKSLASLNLLVIVM